jgi:hypothetical protein
MTTLFDLTEHLKARAQEQGFNGYDFGYIAKINEIPNAEFPFFHIIQGTPDSFANQEEVLRGAPYEYHNINIIGWDLYPKSEQSDVILSQKWANLTTLLFKTIEAAFAPEYIKQFVMMKGYQIPIYRSRAQHNQDLVEVKMQLSVRTYLGDV